MKIYILLFVGTLFSPPLLAYVGPGAGLSAIGSILAFIGAILLMFVGFLWYPIKRFIKRNQPEPEPMTTQSKDKIASTQDKEK